MPPCDSQATRRRLLDAAYVEFAQYGIAGARVERIAEAAESNKAQIYHYFGSKTQLFDAVFQKATTQMEAEVPSDPDDLAGYAGRLVGLHERRPEIIRICTWQRLERSHGEPGPLGVAFARSQVKVSPKPRKPAGSPPISRRASCSASCSTSPPAGLWSVPNTRPPSTSPTLPSGSATSKTQSVPSSRGLPAGLSTPAATCRASATPGGGKSLTLPWHLCSASRLPSRPRVDPEAA